MSYTVKHNNRSQNRDFNLYTEEYFGGSDAFIYINGKRDHNIASIQFTVQEQHKPIYGYGSRTFDDLAVGNRIVIGAMRIPVKNTDESTFSNNWGVQQSPTTTVRGSDIVPSWVYNYVPEKTSNTVVVENEDKDTLSIISKVQKSLGVEVNGFMDENTRKAISQYRKDNEMMIGTLIDNEILCELGVEDYKCYSSKRNGVYDSPLLENQIFEVGTGQKLVFVASEGDVALIRTSDGKSGYINMEDIYRK